MSFERGPGPSTIGGGVAGTIVLSVVLVIAEVEARFELGIAPTISRYAGVGDQPALGLLVFLLAGMVVFPLASLALADSLRRLPGGRDPAIRGMAFSLPLWVAYAAIGTPDPTTLDGASPLVHAVRAAPERVHARCRLPLAGGRVAMRSTRAYTGE